MAKILIVGGGGMVGQKLAHKLAADPLGAQDEITLFDMAFPDDGAPVAERITGNVTEPGIFATLAARRFDIVFHLAAIVSGEAEARCFGETSRGLADLAPQMAAACGEQYTTEELEKIGERIWNMEREFNNRAGFTEKDDNLPKRLLTEATKTGPAKGKVSMLPEMLPKYYQARGWDPQGRPTAETKARLGL